jgi:hypothetical protein
MPNFHYYALQYVDDWFRWDKKMSDGLKSSTDKLEALQVAAQYYGVGRTLHKTQDEIYAEKQGPVAYKAVRLSRALSRLDATVIGIDPVNAVLSLASALEEEYGQNVVSAASKFLWLRSIESDIVIFDTRARTALRALMNNGNNYEQYGAYHADWLEVFSRVTNGPAIAEACNRLLEIGHWTSGSGGYDLNSVISQTWFHHRVFDKYLWDLGGESGFFVMPPAAL